MKRLIGLTVLGCVLSLGSCRGPEKSSPPQDRSEGRTSQARQTDATATAGFEIQTLRMLPAAATVVEDLTIEPAVSGFPPETAIEYEYRWFINDHQVPDVSGPVLSRSFFHKNQWVHCQVRARAEGQETNWKKSVYVRIANSSPRIEPQPTEEFALPGRFSHAISASDPDGDTLTYELIAPLDAGIELDPSSGLLTWDLSAENARPFIGSEVKIEFVVSDGDSGRASATLMLPLKDKR